MPEPSSPADAAVRAARLERLAGVADAIDPEAVLAFPDQTDETEGADGADPSSADAPADTPQRWLLLAECDPGRWSHDVARAELERAITRTLPGTAVQVVLLAPDWLARDEQGHLDRNRSRNRWFEQRRRMVSRAVEPKLPSPSSPSSPSSTMPHPPDPDDPVAGSGTVPGAPAPLAEAYRIVREALLERHPGSPALARLNVSERLVAADRLTPVEVLTLIDDLGLRARQPLHIRSLADIGGATIDSLARLLEATLGHRHEGEPSAPTGGLDGAGGAGGADGADDAAPSDHGDDAVRRPAADADPQGFIRSLVAGRVGGPFADPVAGAGSKPDVGQSDPTPAMPPSSATVPLEPRSPVAARRAGGSGIRRAARTLRRAGVPVRPGLVAYAPLWITVAPGATVEIGRNVTLMPDVVIRVDEGATLRLHAGVTIASGVRVQVRAGTTQIGADSLLHPGVVLDAGSDLTIGRETIIGVGATVIAVAATGTGTDTDTHAVHRSPVAARGSDGSGAVVIEAGSTIAAGTHLTPGAWRRDAA